MDIVLRTLRAEGYAWRVIAQTLGVSSLVVRQRARALGLDTREYLSSGTLTGVAINQGARPVPQRFRAPSLTARLGRKWIK